MKELCRKYILENAAVYHDLARYSCVFFEADEPDQERCSAIEKGLRLLISEGNRESAIYYAFIAANDELPEIFSEAFALETLLKMECMEESAISSSSMYFRLLYI